MRTNIVLDDDLLAQAQRYSKSRSKRALIEEALAAFVAMKSEERRRASYLDRLGALREKTRALRLRSDTREIVREGRDSR